MYEQKIISFRKLIERSAAGFVGRRWVREAVDDFLAAEGPRYFLLLGEPGSGKTSFLADLVKERQYPHHFIGPGSQLDVERALDWRNPIRFAESVGYQLLRDYGGWVMDWESWGIQVDQHVRQLEGRLVGASVDTFHAAPRLAAAPKLSIEQEVEQYGSAAEMIGVYIKEFVADVEQIVQQLFITPVRRIAQQMPDSQLVLVVDALDEAADYSNEQQNILKLLELGAVPANVRIICSSRPGPHLTYAFLQQARQFWLSEDERGQRDERALEDVALYLQQVVDEPSVAAVLADRKMTSAQVVPAVAAASQGNFLYLYHYAAGLRRGDADLLDLTTLPRGLYGIYADFLGKIRQGRTVEAWTGAYKPVLGTLVVAQAPLTRRQIAPFAQVSQEETATILLQIGQFVDRTGTGAGRRYVLYHRSFGEFLVSDENEDVIDAQAAHARIVTYYRSGASSWEEIDWQDVDEYGLLYLSKHLYALRHDRAYSTELYRLICWPLMEVKRVRTGSDRSFADDVDLAFRMAAAEKPHNWAQLVRSSLLNTTLGSLVANIPPQMLVLLARAGRVRAAEGYAALLRDDDERSEAYQQISVALLAKGDTEQALAFAQRITVAWRRAVALIPLLDERGDRTAVSEVVTRALAEVAPRGQVPQRSDSLQALAVALARVGDIEQLNRIFTLAFASELQKAAVLQEVIRTLGQAGRLPGLSRPLSSVDVFRYNKNKADVFVTIAQELITLGDPLVIQQALERLAAPDLEENRAGIIATLAPDVAARGTIATLEQLQSLAEHIDDDRGRLQALSALARAAAQTGDSTRVSDLAPQIVRLGGDSAGDDPAASASIQSNIAETLASIGAVHEAKRAIEQALTAALRTRFDARFGLPGNELLDLVRVLAQAGAFDSALDLAEFAPRPADRIYVRNQIASILVESGENERAQALVEETEAFAKDIVDSEVRALLLGWSASVHKQLGNRETAAELIDTAARSVEAIDDNVTRARLLTEASALFVQLDFPDRAQTVAAQAADSAAAIDDNAAKLIVLGKLATASPAPYRDTLLKRTAQVADEIDHQAGPLSNPTRVVETLAQAGLHDRAWEIASHRGKAKHESDLLIAVMRGVWAQEPEAMREVAIRCGIAAKEIAAPTDRAIALEFVARTLLQAGAYHEALDIAESIEHPDLVPQAFAKIALALAQIPEKQQAGDLAVRALEALTPGRAEQIQTRVLCDIALAYMYLDQDREASDLISQAETAATAIGSPVVRTRELIRVAETYYSLGEPQQATTVAERAVQMLPLNHRIAYGLAAVVRARVLLGDYDAALELLNMIQEPARPGGFSLLDVVKPLLQIGKVDEALTLVERVGVDGESGYVLDAIAEALTQTPDNPATVQTADRVLQLAPSLKAGRIQAGILSEIASFLAMAGEVERPKALSRQVLASLRKGEDISFSGEILAKTTRVLGHVNDRDGLELALESAAILNLKQDRLKVQIVIAQVFLEIGVAERAIDIATGAMEFTGVEGDKHLYTQARALGAMCHVMSDVGEPEQALALARRSFTAAKAIRYYAGQSGGEADKDGALAATALAIARTSEIDEALTIVKVIMSKLDQVCILREAARELVQAGSESKARRAAKQAKTLALEHEETFVKAYLLCAAAQAVAAIGDTTDARNLLRRVQEMEPRFENTANKALIWSVLAQVFAQIGDEELAVDSVQVAWNAAQDSSRPWERAWAFFAVGSAMTNLGMEHQAVRTAEQALASLDLVDPTLNERTLSNFHLYPLMRFNPIFAQIAAGIPWQSRLAVLLAVAHVLVSAHNLAQAAIIVERAASTANAMKEDLQQLAALSLVSGAMTAAGQREQALAVLYAAMTRAYRLGRQELLTVLWFAAPTIAAIDRDRHLTEMVKAVVEIVDHWPPETRTLEQATRQDGLWDAVVGVAGQQPFEG